MILMISVYTVIPSMIDSAMTKIRHYHAQEAKQDGYVSGYIKKSLAHQNQFIVVSQFDSAENYFTAMKKLMEEKQTNPEEYNALLSMLETEPFIAAYGDL
ncbi:hypothetical protein GOV04_03395 [Candidatus Woesearchaeota archaeon]|nr:hypothetical protein [Candidatus Woesearchaeota archaeon]